MVFSALSQKGLKRFGSSTRSVEVTLARVFKGINILDSSNNCGFFWLPSPFGRGLGEGLSDRSNCSVLLRETSSLNERTRLSQSKGFIRILSPHPRPFSQREKGEQLIKTLRVALL